MSLTEFEAEEDESTEIKITIAHLKRIVELSSNFQKYIASMHRYKSDAYVARRNQLRNDYYRETPVRKVAEKPDRSRDVGVDDDEKVSRGKTTKGRNGKNTLVDEDQEDTDRRSKARINGTRTALREISEEEIELPRSRGQQPKQKGRWKSTPGEDESEEEARRLRRARRRIVQSEEEEEESEAVEIQIKKPGRTPRSVYQDDDEQEEEVLRSNKPSRVPARSKTLYDVRVQSRSPARALKRPARKTKKVVSESEEE